MKLKQFFKLVIVLFSLLVYSSCKESFKKVSGKTEHVLYLDSENNIQHIKLLDKDMTVQNLTELSGAPLPNDNISALIYKNSCMVWYLDVNDEIIQLNSINNNYSYLRLSDMGNYPKAIGKISPYYDTEKEEITLTYRSQNNTIKQVIVSKDTLREIDLNSRINLPKASGSPVILQQKKGYSIVYADDQNEIHQIIKNNDTYEDKNISKISKNIKTSKGGEISVMVVGDQEHIFFNDVNNSPNHIIIEGEKVRMDDWIKVANSWRQRVWAPNSFSDYTSYYINEKENIFYLDENNDIYNLVYQKGKFKGYNWTKYASLPMASETPVIAKYVE